MTKWLDRPKVAALCGFCWTDDVNAECPEHGREAEREKDASHALLEIGRLKADNARLRALVNEKANAQFECAWCGREKPGGMSTGRIEHARDCRACTPEGVVK